MYRHMTKQWLMVVADSLRERTLPSLPLVCTDILYIVWRLGDEEKGNNAFESMSF